MKKIDQTKLKPLISFLAQARSADEWHELLDALFTERERKELVRRLTIVRLLRQGVSQREIARQLEVGIATVTRGSKVFRSKTFDSLK